MGKVLAAACGFALGSIITALTIRNIADDVLNQTMDALTKDDDFADVDDEVADESAQLTAA